MATPAGWYQDPWAAGGYMRWWDGRRWSGHVHPAPVRPVAPAEPRSATAEMSPWWPLDWSTWPPPRNIIAGESHYQDVLQSLCGAPCESGYLIPVAVTLRREPDNPYDPNAMRAEVHGRKVGYLRKEIALVVAPALEQNGVPHVTVCGIVRGGSSRATFIGCHLWLDRPLDGPRIVIEDIDHVDGGWLVGWPPHDHEALP